MGKIHSHFCIVFLVYNYCLYFISLENSRIYFNGKSIFTLNESYGNKLWHLGNGEYITRQNFEITDFQKYCLDSDGNFDDLVDVVAGDNLFVVLTSKLLFIN